MDETNKTIDGNYLKAFVSVYEAFKRVAILKHLPKDLEHYRFEFGEEGEFYHVRVISKTKSRKVGHGYEGDFWVRKKDYEYVGRMQNSGKGK